MGKGPCPAPGWGLHTGSKVARRAHQDLTYKLEGAKKTRGQQMYSIHWSAGAAANAPKCTDMPEGFQKSKPMGLQEKIQLNMAEHKAAHQRSDKVGVQDVQGELVPLMYPGEHPEEGTCATGW